MSAASTSQAQQSDEQSSSASQPLGSYEVGDVGRIRDAAQVIGKAFRDNHYAIIGGAACTLLGST